MLALIIPIGIIILMFLYMCIIWDCREERQFGRRNRSNSGSSISINSRMSIASYYLEKQTTNLKIVLLYTEEITKDDYDTCGICLDDNEEDNTMVKLPCNHIFHQSCIEKWARTQINSNLNPECPVCRNEIKYQKHIE